MANEHIVVLKKSGGNPEIEFLIGNAQWGSYEVNLLIQGSNKWENLGKGVNWDEINDRFSIDKTPTQLNGAQLFWTMAITPLHVGDPYIARVNVFQDGQVVEGGKVTYQGTTLLQAHPLAGFVKLVAI